MNIIIYLIGGLLITLSLLFICLQKCRRVRYHSLRSRMEIVNRAIAKKVNVEERRSSKIYAMEDDKIL